MKLSSFRRIITQDYDKQFQSLIENLGSNINDAFNGVYQALNKRLTFNDNIACTVRDVQITVDSSGSPTAVTTFSLDVQNTPVIGVLVLSVQNLENTAAYPLSSPFISYIQVNNAVRINNITGLEPNVLYRIKVLAIN